MNSEMVPDRCHDPAGTPRPSAVGPPAPGAPRAVTKGGSNQISRAMSSDIKITVSRAGGKKQAIERHAGDLVAVMFTKGRRTP
jgi:hypothetical protein